MERLERETEIKRWGNSAGIMLSKTDFEKIHVKPGDKVKIDVAPLRLRVGVLARKNNLKFLTGDPAFKGLANVEFVQ